MTTTQPQRRQSLFSTTHQAVPIDINPDLPSIIVVPLFQQAHPPFLLSLPSHCRTKSRIHKSSASKTPSSFIASSTFPWLLHCDLDFSHDCFLQGRSIHKVDGGHESNDINMFY
ncbi:hypothetical protein GBA52_015151 [Prunus armeniaca]|nr:hypothetical protein GBA52_015151 [Prunus armeniaca]